MQKTESMPILCYLKTLTKDILPGILLLYFCAFFGEAGAQKQPSITAMLSADVAAPAGDLRKLDPHFTKVRLVGMGESTHGTREFFTMRHRFFQYLVEVHNFNTFFMEAEVTDCFVINKYIRGDHSNLMQAMASLKFWPWKTEEMKALIIWMRKHNNLNPANQITFIGVDSQHFNTARFGIQDLLKKYSLPAINDLIGNHSDRDFLLMKARELKPYKSFVAQLAKIDSSTMNKQDQMMFNQMITHCKQALAKRTSPVKTLRDHEMALNTLNYLRLHPDARGFFWGHNGHVATLFNDKKQIGVAGGYLKKALGDAYFSIGQDFDKGSFNAYYKVEKKKAPFPAGYQLGTVIVAEAAPKSFAANFRKYNHGFLFIPFSSLPFEEPVTISSIGAICPKNVSPNSLYRFNHHGQKSFDAIVLILDSSPTQLIKD